ncbi:TetR family transcriptional regulator [Flavobacterium psychrophilum]|nr:TetR family transcriptional regulator [Flavobacterium psychrophilum]
MVNRIVSIIEQVNPEYSFAKSLASTIIEGSLHQHFLKEHLKTITNCNQEITPTDFYLNLITTLFKNKNMSPLKRFFYLLSLDKKDVYQVFFMPFLQD